MGFIYEIIEFLNFPPFFSFSSEKCKWLFRKCQATWLYCLWSNIIQTFWCSNVHWLRYITLATQNNINPLQYYFFLLLLTSKNNEVRILNIAVSTAPLMVRLHPLLYNSLASSFPITNNIWVESVVKKKLHLHCQIGHLVHFQFT